MRSERHLRIVLHIDQRTPLPLAKLPGLSAETQQRSRPYGYDLLPASRSNICALRGYRSVTGRENG